MSRKPKTAHDDGPVDVEAVETGYYGGIIRRPGDKFRIAHLSEYSHRWMGTTDARTLAIGVGSNPND